MHRPRRAAAPPPPKTTKTTTILPTDCGKMVNTTTRDWSNLPPELLEKIAAHLPHLPDLFRFRSVWSPWRSAAKSTIPNLSRQLPWLYLEPDVEASMNSNRRFFSLSESRIYTLPLPLYYRTDWIFSSSCGRVIAHTNIDFLTGTRHLSLLNPITRTTTPLPPLLSVQSAPIKFKLFAPDLIATVCSRQASDLSAIFFCRRGETAWRSVDSPSCPAHGDFAYHSGCFFVFDDGGGSTGVFDEQSLQKVTEIPFPEPFMGLQHYLVESSSGELLLVIRHPRGVKERFELFRLHASGEWTETMSIGNDALFVDDAHAMCFDAGGFEGCRGNCIYFLDYHEIDKGYRRREGSGLRLFDVDKGQVERALLFRDNARTRWWFSSWFVPSLG